MSLQVREHYQNPLTMQKARPNIISAQATPEKAKKADADLRTERQSVQNELLLMKSTTNGSAATAETQKLLNEKLEEINAKLSSAPRYDVYERTLPR